MSFQSTNSDSLREEIEKYISKWKWFAVSIFFFILLALVYLRYATELYSIQATIKIANVDDNNDMLSEANQVNKYGLFSNQSNSVNDEIEVLKSRPLVENIVNELNLNIRYFIKGKISSYEVYKNPPVTVNFFSSDSILKKLTQL